MTGPAPRPRKPFKTLAAGIEHEIDPIKGSRFLTVARPVSSEAEADAVVTECRERWPEASHHCWAWALYDGKRHRSSDDGEPGGSAGRPILAQLEGRELHDLVVVVVRWFGGTKLGVGGLIRAYGGAAAKTLDRAELVTVTPKRPLIIDYDYDLTTAVETTLRELDLSADQPEFGASVKARLAIPDADWDAVRGALEEATRGRITFSEPDA